MTRDPRVVERVARTLWRHDTDDPWDDFGDLEHGDYLQCAKECLDAIDAATDENGNRIAWVAPWEPTDRMWDVVPEDAAYFEWRDAYLAERQSCLTGTLDEVTVTEGSAEDIRRALHEIAKTERRGEEQ